MLSVFKKLFTSEPEEKKTVHTVSNFSWLEENNYIAYNKKFNPKLETVLLMDDREIALDSILCDLEELENYNESFNLDNYNVLLFTTKFAAFNVLETLEKCPDLIIDYAILDIFLGGKKTIDGKRKLLDGVDVAIALKERNEDINVLFFSGFIPEDTTSDIFNYRSKFEEIFKNDIEQFILSKDTDIKKELEDLCSFFEI